MPELAERRTSGSILSGFIQRIRKPRPQGRHKGPVVVDGETGLETTLAQCCSPLPPDPIVGLITRTRGVSVHQGSCGNLLSAPVERRIHVSWAEQASEPFAVFVRVVTINRPGVLASLSKIIGKANVNIHSVQAATTDDRGVLSFELGVQSTEQLLELLKAIEGQEEVFSIERQTRGEAERFGGKGRS